MIAPNGDSKTAILALNTRAMSTRTKLGDNTLRDFNHDEHSNYQWTSDP